MATASEVDALRKNTNLESNDSEFSDEMLSTLIDEHGVNLATAVVWRRKAATYVELVDVSEAGASRKYSDLHKNALAMAAVYDKGSTIENPTAATKSAKVHKIVRS